MRIEGNFMSCHGWRAHFYFTLNNIPLPAWALVYASIHLPKDSLVPCEINQDRWVRTTPGCSFLQSQDEMSPGTWVIWVPYPRPLGPAGRPLPKSLPCRLLTSCFFHPYVHPAFPGNQPYEENVCRALWALGSYWHISWDCRSDTLWSSLGAVASHMKELTPLPGSDLPGGGRGRLLYNTAYIF